MRTLCLLAICLFIVTTYSSCKRKCHDKTNPDCANYDPCNGKVKTSAEFVVEEHLTPSGPFLGKDVWIESDSINGSDMNHVVRFTALHDADSFIWNIGAQTFYTKSVKQYGFPQNEIIPIQLIVINKHPNSKCFPKDNGRDTVIKNIFCWPPNSNNLMGTSDWKMYNNYPINGYFKGYYKSNPKKEVVIKFWDSAIYCEYSNPKWIKCSFVKNIPDGYCSSYKISECGRLNYSNAAPYGALGHFDVFNTCLKIP